ncbi:glycerol-3-phosphate dehydrogenase/oxidase [Nesterenkonia lutea]
MARTSPENPLDILIVGGGVVGAAAAFDAATRGLDVALVEARDFGEGTSSRSSRLVHGGLRYLQMLDFKLVAEALRERDLLLTHTAPHLVRALPFIFPFEKRVIERAFIGSGVTLYDALQLRSAGRRTPGSSRGWWSRRAVPFHRHLSRTKLRHRFPGLDEERFIGALEYFDAQVDDARLVLTLARSAHSLGAQLASRTEAVDYLRDDTGRVIGARLRDLETGQEADVHARETILATGVWTGAQQEAAGTGTGLQVRASKGIHITVPRRAIAAVGDVGVISQTEKSVLFIIPMRDVWAIGTTDTAWRQPVDAPAPTRQDIRYILDHANAVLGENLQESDVLGTWAGLRPLVQPVAAEETSSAKVSREHTVMQLAEGLTGVAGGKLTTYRVMAQDVIDFACRGTFTDRRSLTESIPLLGAQGYSDWKNRTAELVFSHGFSRDRVDRLLNRYGSLLGELLELIDADPSLVRPLAKAPEHLRAEIAYAVLHEGALHVDDLLSRRTRLFQETADRGLGALDEVLDLAAGLLGWNAERIAAERHSYELLVRAQRAAEESEDDASAAALLQQAQSQPTWAPQPSRRAGHASAQQPHLQKEGI